MCIDCRLPSATIIAPILSALLRVWLVTCWGCDWSPVEDVTGYLLRMWLVTCWGCDWSPEVSYNLCLRYGSITCLRLSREVPLPYICKGLSAARTGRTWRHQLHIPDATSCKHLTPPVSRTWHHQLHPPDVPSCRHLTSSAARTWRPQLHAPDVTSCTHLTRLLTHLELITDRSYLLVY